MLTKQTFRFKQIWDWLYGKGVSDFSDMVNIPLDLREKLSEKYSICRPEVLKTSESNDGSVKFLIKLSSGHKAETVYMPTNENKVTVCVSSQDGCAMSCKFCNTGTQGMCGNLTSRDIVEQVAIAKDYAEDWHIDRRKITNIVFMGMGEPMNNMDNVIQAINLISGSDSMNISSRKILVSTCGIPQGIERIAKETKVKLAISLHATTDKIRNRIMPINEKFPIDTLLKACSEFSRQRKGDQITFEYLILEGINDSNEDAKRLIELAKLYEIPCKFNLLHFNSWKGASFKAVSTNRMIEFASIIKSYGYECPVRLPRGRDIMAACGQLKSSNENNA